MAQRWFKLIAGGNVSLEDKQHAGGPQIWDSMVTKQPPSRSRKNLQEL
jgi:hypothetical protein